MNTVFDEALSKGRLEFIAEKVNAQFDSLSEAVLLVMAGPVKEARYRTLSDPASGQPSGSVTLKASAGRDGAPTLLFHSFREGLSWAEFLRDGRLFSERPEVRSLRQSWKQAEVQTQARDAAKVELARRIVNEGRRASSSLGHDYFQEKRMQDWSGARYTSQRYEWNDGAKLCFLSPGLPFWAGVNAEAGEVQCVQARFWSSKRRGWAVVTCGAVKGAQVEFPPDVSGADPETVPIVLCEGVSTAWGMLRILGGRAFVVATLGKNNLVRCAQAARARFGETRSLFVMADVDANGVGQNAAIKASWASGAIALTPILRSSRPTGGENFDAWDLWVQLSNHEGGEVLGIEDFLPLEAPNG